MAGLAAVGALRQRRRVHGRGLGGVVEVEGRGVAGGGASESVENGFVESFHSRLRDEFLDRVLFEKVADVKAQAEAFKKEFNTVRPHSGLGYQTPRAFAATRNPGERKTAK